MSFLNNKEIEHLILTSKSNNTVTKATRCAFIERMEQPLYPLKKSTFTFEYVTSLKHRAKELRMLLNATTKSKLCKIANLAPNTQEEIYASMMHFVLKTKDFCLGLRN